MGIAGTASIQPGIQSVMHPGGTSAAPKETRLGIRVDIAF